MRQAQHGKKPRGRGRKPHNPLSRVYDSNGPDVKIRGSASHIADKYLTLARDAHSSGDRIAAESYHQHAEHYLRIVAAAQAQMVTNAPQNAEQQPSEEAREQQGASGAENAENAQSQPQQQAQGDGRPRRSRNRRNNGAARAAEQSESAQPESTQPDSAQSESAQSDKAQPDSAQPELNGAADPVPADLGGAAAEPAGNGTAETQAAAPAPAPSEEVANTHGDGDGDAAEKNPLSPDPLNA